MRKQKKWLMPVALAILTVTLLSSIFAPMILAVGGKNYGSSPYINLFDNAININNEQFFDSSVIYKLPSGVKDTDELSLIVKTNSKTLLDGYDASLKNQTFSEYFLSEEADGIRDSVESEIENYYELLDSAGISYEKGETYSVVLSGFEITAVAADFEKICKILGNNVSVIIGEEYNVCETEVVENNVNVFDTGIFNTTGFEYDGTGTVVAVLDTGLDYYHSAFSTSNFTADRNKLGLTFEEVSAVIMANNMAAERLQPGLTASDVYINEKVPYGFDYADGDSEVFPIQSDHGTHVSGIIAGKDDTITGVAPNAQLVEMKIFSDLEATARASWILAALEDCVALGVDVINMSIGTACGFSRESDKEQISGVYDRIRERGISMVVAASNSFNSSYGSDKNGNLPLTSNPDSATVGSPSTYDGVLCVASISGTKTSYLLHDGKIIYFVESSDKFSEEKNFVNDLIKEGKETVELEYITIPGVGREADYTGIDITGKIALVRRGSTTFEEKANTAEKMGAAGIIIYNNVSGEIKMNVGETKIAVCSISQDDGEVLASVSSGKITISTKQLSGPFMSDFSSWGPTPDLQLKPEITAHGGSILSSVPGQAYDRISGTSMATPNVSGLTALLRQYVTEKFPESISQNPVKVNEVVNRLMMSTADIVLNKNGLPYSPRKQGAGLVNLLNCSNTGAYILTYDKDGGQVMDKSKIELGDDPAKTGVYTLKFAIDNFGSQKVSYDLSCYVMTEGVSATKTNKGETTVTEEAYILEGAEVVITSVSGGVLNGKNISVEAGATANVTVTVTLTEENKKYLDDSFENGMYIEGFVVLDAKDEETVDLSVPYLAFYGDWTVAPIFDLDYFETNKDELDDSIDLLDKTLPDAFATRPIGGISEDYVSYLGSFYYEQDPSTKQVSAKREYISLTNQTDGINSLRFVWAGLLRNTERVHVSIVEDSTGEVVFETTDYDIRKAYGDGGPIRPANIDIEFSAIENNLKNNTKYTVTLTGYLDYGDGGVENNLNNTFSFPLVTDFEAPSVTDVEFYTEYDRNAKKNRLYAKIAVYDNHYSMAGLVGYISYDEVQEGFAFNNFDRYLKPITSEYNSTSYLVYELTDYVDNLKKNIYNPNTFSIVCYDYALNSATYEIGLPTEYIDLYFEESEVTLSPNELYSLNPLVYPGDEWSELLQFSSSNPSVARVVNNKVLAVAPGQAAIIATAKVNGVDKHAILNVTVLGEGDDGFVRYDKPVTDNFHLVSYTTNKAFYFLASEDRDIGKDGDIRQFVGENYSLSFYPSEQVTVAYELDAYFPNSTEVKFESSNTDIVTVDGNGKITAVAEGFASVSVKVLMDGKSTYYAKNIDIEVKDPYVNSGPTLTNYYGNGGKVVIPSTLAITEIGQYCFSNFDYVSKPIEEVTEESPEYTEITYIGEHTIEEVVIPEGVEKIGPYAFANLSKLKKVTLPSTLTTIDLGAFFNCTSLTTVVGIENVKFINQYGFANCNLQGTLNLGKAIAISDYSFAGNKNLSGTVLPESTQSIGAYAFAGDVKLKTVTVNAGKVKLGQYAFDGCTKLESISINTPVIPVGAFNDCLALKNITLGADVAVIGEYAFRNTKIAKFTLSSQNGYLKSVSDGAYLTNKAGNELIAVAPATAGAFTLPSDSAIVKIGSGAFSGNANITSVNMPSVKKVSSYAFAECVNLHSAVFSALEEIGDYAFTNTDISSLPAFAESLKVIGAHSFGGTNLTAVVIPDGMTVGRYAFTECGALASVKIGNRVKLEDYAFSYNIDRNHYEESPSVTAHDGVTKIFYYIYVSPLHSLTIGNDVQIGDYAFFGAAELTGVTLGDRAIIGDYAFYNASSLSSIDLSKAEEIGNYAFSGDVVYWYIVESDTVATDASGEPLYEFYSPVFLAVDISSVGYLGEHAFEFCEELTSVTLGENLKSIKANTFNYCKKLANINLDYITFVGSNAFAEGTMTEISLPSVETIDKYAFVNNLNLTTVNLGDNITEIGEGAFSNDAALSTVTNLGKAKKIGDYAFTYTALTSADLTSAEEIGTHAFMKENLTDFEVRLGENLCKVGDNPFAFCKIQPIYKIDKEIFNGKEYETRNFTFDISEKVRVIDGSLYIEVPRGLELIAYIGNEKTVTIPEGTVRLGAFSFAGSSVTNVTLPYTVEAIGHKAFYNCEKLAIVTFTSYDAPILEEEYDIVYFNSGQAYPNPTEDGGLGIIKYTVWNVSSLPSNVFYGANFVDYVGKVDNKLIMIRPVNGQNYNSFIFGQYFDLVFDGAAAADDTTLAAIEAINKIPEDITLSDKPLVEAARAAYDKVASFEQKSLVYNYQKLADAEKRIIDLEYLANQPADEPTGEPQGLPVYAIILIIVASVVGAGGIGAGIFFLIRYLKKKGGNTPPDEPNKNGEETSAQDNDGNTSSDGEIEIEIVEITEDAKENSDASDVKAESEKASSEETSADADKTSSENKEETPSDKNETED